MPSRVEKPRESESRKSEYRENRTDTDLWFDSFFNLLYEKSRKSDCENRKTARIGHNIVRISQYLPVYSDTAADSHAYRENR